MKKLFPLYPLSMITNLLVQTRTLKLLKKDISAHLVDIFNLSFSSEIYPPLLKTAKVVPIHKKDSKLECSNYRPIALLSNIEKFLEKIMHKRLSIFLEKNKLIYSLQLDLDRIIQLLMH